jgi:hypothetical protein
VAIRGQQTLAVLSRFGFVQTHENTKKVLFRHSKTGEEVYLDQKTEGLVIHPKHEPLRPEFARLAGVTEDRFPYHAANMPHFPRRMNRGRSPSPYGIKYSFASEEALRAFFTILLGTAARDTKTGPETDALRESGMVDEAGYETDPHIRERVERYAEDVVRKLLESEGYAVHKLGKPYDFRCIRGGEEIRVEVKGTRSSGQAVHVTAGEVRHARSSKATHFFLVRNIRFNPGAGNTVLSGGEVLQLQPWVPSTDDLVATDYRYAVPVHRMVVRKRLD